MGGKCQGSVKEVCVLLHINKAVNLNADNIGTYFVFMHNMAFILYVYHWYNQFYTTNIQKYTVTFV